MMRLLGARRLRVSPALLFIAPSVAIIAVFIIYPIGQSFWYSLHDWRIGAKTQPWRGLGNYRDLFGDERFRNALRVTIVFTVASVALLLVLGYAAASALRRETLFNRIVRSVLFFPTIVSLTTIGMVWRFLLDPDIGIVGGIASAIGVEPVAFLRDTRWALPSVIFVNVWKNVGFSMVILLAGLKGVPPELYEAARLDGASERQLTRHVTLPSIRPTLMFTTMILTINSMQIFDLVHVMTQGGPVFSTDTLLTVMFREGFTRFHVGTASAIAWTLFAIILLLSLLQLRLFRYRDVD